MIDLGRGRLRHAGLVLAAVVWVGCGADPGQDGPIPEDQGMTEEEPEQKSVDRAAAEATPAPTGQSSVAGALVEAQTPSAQPLICVTLDQGRVTAIDGIACEQLPVGHAMCGDCEAWSFCNGCLLLLEQDDDQATLTARADSSSCTAYAGSYELSTSKACAGPKSP